MTKKLNYENTLTLLSEKIVKWYEILVKSVPNIIAAAIILFLFILLAKLTKKILNKLLPRITKNKAVIELLKTISYFLVLTLGLFVSLEILNLEKTVTSILAGAGVIGLALGFAFQEIASNFVSGIFIAFRKPYKLGDIVEIDQYFGNITEINLRTTNITTFQGLEVLIPNKYMFTKPFTNLTTTPRRRIDINVGVSYEDNLNKVELVTKKALEEVDERIKNMPVEVFFSEFGASSIDLTARFWIHYPADQSFLKAKHKAIIYIKEAYDENNITIPFPIRTIDFGSKN